MISVQFFNDETQSWDAAIVPNKNGGLQTPIDLTDRFDEALSEGSIKILTDGHDMPVPVTEWTKARLDIDGDVRYYFVSGCDTSITVRKRQPVHEVEVHFIELLKATQRLTMDNLNFSNDIDSSGNVTTRSIGAVLDRLNKQLFTVLETDRANVPFKFTYNSGMYWANLTAPELFFTECTLFDALVRVGEVFGGYPYLEFIASGEYELKYKIFDDPNTAHYVDNSYMDMRYHTTIEGQANVLDSLVKNMLNASENGENTAVYPAYDGYKAISAEDYVVTLTEGNVFIRLNNPIYKIFKVELAARTLPADGLDYTLRYSDISDRVLEFDIWKTLPDGSFFTDLAERKNTKMGNLYYTYGGDKIQNIEEFCKNYEMPVGTGYLPRVLTFSLRVTYIPMLETRIKSKRQKKLNKPLAQVLNQQANIVNAGAYASYLQGLVNRMDGKSRVLEILKLRNPKNPNYKLYKIGEWLNGEIITEARYIISNRTAYAIYTTSETFNRRTPFVELSHELRQWAIPADSKVSDRNIHYGENIEWMINQDFPYGHNGCLTEAGLNYVAAFTGTENPPNLAYIAWKTDRQMLLDSDENSIDYALASCNSVPVGNSITMTWRATDNASMGSRSYDRDNRSVTQFDRQMFVQYNPKAQYLQFKLAEQKPLNYNFDNAYTLTGSEGVQNQDFEHCFCLSNKQQYREAASLMTFNGNALEKDLRERILFNYQLDSIGLEGTIAYEGSTRWSSLCNSSATNIRIFINRSGDYGFWDKTGQGQEIGVTGVSYSSSSIVVAISGNISYNNLAICDSSGRLILATNAPGSVSQIVANFRNRKQEWIKV